MQNKKNVKLIAYSFSFNYLPIITIFQVALKVIGTMEVFVKLMVQPVVVIAEKLNNSFSKLPVPLITLAANTTGATVKVVPKVIGPVWYLLL